MPTDHRAVLKDIRTFPSLVRYLRDEMGWPIDAGDFEELTFEYTPEELGIDAKNAAKIEEIKRLRPLATSQPWGIFFVKFERKKLPVVALRRILSQVALKKRTSANRAERAAWAKDDLLFVSNYGEGEERQISFAHFSQAESKQDLPTLKVLGWDNLDTPLHLDAVAEKLTRSLAWPEDDRDVEAWRKAWRNAFTLRHREVITTSRDLSIRLAKLARAIRDRISSVLDIETEIGPLTKLMKAFQEALVHDLNPDGFADMYAQTISYGLLSARVANPQSGTADDLPAHMPVTNPFLKELMETFLHVGGRRGKAGGPGIDFDELGVSEVVELLDDAKMESVVRDFDDRNPQEDPVIHFYELFLKEYDAKKRMQRGVFYTPRPVVSYIVRSVDELLRSELGLEDGLADTSTWGEIAKRHKNLEIPSGVDPNQAFLQILDPATGTGTFLVEVLDLIHRRMTEKWKALGHSKKKIEALWNDYVPNHLLPRLHGYELLMAPYAIAHLKIGLKLQATGYLFGSAERARIYLTNALEPAHDFSDRLAFAIPALAREAQAVNLIKNYGRFTLVIGNPPYSIQSQNLADVARLWVDPYRYVDGELIREKGALQFEKSLQDDCIKFASLSQQQIIRAGAGALGMIMSHSFIDNPTLRGMRHSLAQTFDTIYVLDLHGNTTKKERCPDGSEDKNVFDIKQGVAVLLATRSNQIQEKVVLHADAWGTRSAKYALLQKNSHATMPMRLITPTSPSYLFKPQDVHTREEFDRCVKITDVFIKGNVGIISARDNMVIDFEPAPLIERAQAFRDSLLPDEALCEQLEISLKKGWDIRRARERIKRDDDLEGYVKPLCYRPFDTRFIFYHPALVWGMSYPTMQHMLRGNNLAMMVGRAGQVIGQGEWDIVFCTRALTEFNLYRRGGHNLFPLYLKPSINDYQADLGGNSDYAVNISPKFLRAIADVISQSPTENAQLPLTLEPDAVFYYIYAIFYSPGYRNRYAEFLKIDFPRLPLPGSLGLFRALAHLGGELVALHLLESPKLDRPITIYSGPMNPEVGRVSWSNDTIWLNADAAKQSQPFTSGTIGFRGVPEAVWNFHIGGYQVCGKWLKDRKGRTLSQDDLAHYQKIIGALSETIRLMHEIDKVIEQHSGWPGAFQPAAESKESAAPTLFRLHRVQSRPEDRYVTCVPLIPLKAAAGAFGEPLQLENDDWEWVAIDTRHRLRPGMFVAQVVGKSMEPTVPDGSYCLFAAPVTGTRQGKTVLVQLRDATDPESGERYTIKRYESEKTSQGDLWHHARITLKPVNPMFPPIEIADDDEDRLQVIAECIDVLGVPE
jgi:hypothetical protein